MDVVAVLLHGLAFVAPAICVALFTTLVARLGVGGASPLRWWSEWAASSAAGSAALLAALWALGRDGTLAWLLSRRRR